MSTSSAWRMRFEKRGPMLTYSRILRSSSGGARAKGNLMSACRVSNQQCCWVGNQGQAHRLKALGLVQRMQRQLDFAAARGRQLGFGSTTRETGGSRPLHVVQDDNAELGLVRIIKHLAGTWAAPTSSLLHTWISQWLRH